MLLCTSLLFPASQKVLKSIKIYRTVCIVMNGSLHIAYLITLFNNLSRRGIFPASVYFSCLYRGNLQCALLFFKHTGSENKYDISLLSDNIKQYLA